jgi:hypothetical protein
MYKCEEDMMIRNLLRVGAEDRNLTNVAVEDLLSDFANSLPATVPRSPKNGSEDKSLIELFKERTVLDDRQKASISENTCISCYFSTAVQTLRKELWCSCVNSERHPDAKYFDLRFWVKVEQKLPCWRHSLINTEEEWATERRGETSSSPLDPAPLVDEDLLVGNATDMATLAERYRKAALRTLERFRKETTSETSSANAQTMSETPAKSERLAPVRRCQNCYYCVETRKLRSSWWCACTHPGRSTESLVAGKMWVKSRLGLVCWTKRES